MLTATMQPQSQLTAGFEPAAAPKPSTLLSSLSMVYFFASIAVIGGTLSACGAVPLALLSIVFQKLGAPHLARKSRSASDRVLVWGIHLLMAVQPWVTHKVKIQIPERRPGHGPGIMLIANHRSHLDAFFLLANVYGIRLFAKSSLFLIPFLGLMMRVSRQIPVKRGSVDGFIAALETIRERLSLGETVHVFPEMTRCAPGAKGTRDFNLAPFHVAYQTKTLILPIVIDGTDRAWPRDEILIRPGQYVSLTALSPVSPTDFASASALRDAVRAQINEALRLGVQA